MNIIEAISQRRSVRNYNGEPLSDEMKEKLSGYLQVLYNADPTSVGGAIPDDNFWYAK